jgi:hypothetical protein
MNDKKQIIKVNTPKGIAKYPWLNKPNTTFNPLGEYKVGLLLPANSAEAESLISQIDGWLEESLKQAKADVQKQYDTAVLSGKGAEAAKKKAELAQIKKAAPPYTVELDKDSGEETGNIEFKFKLKAQITNRKTGKVIKMSPRLFDSAGNALKDDTAIFGGSIIKVNFTPNFTYMPSTKEAFVSLRLNAVQVIELVSGLGSTADSFGFTVEEGYVAEQPMEETIDLVDTNNF